MKPMAIPGSHRDYDPSALVDDLEPGRGWGLRARGVPDVDHIDSCPLYDPSSACRPSGPIGATRVFFAPRVTISFRPSASFPWITQIDSKRRSPVWLDRACHIAQSFRFWCIRARKTDTKSEYAGVDDFVLKIICYGNGDLKTECTETSLQCPKKIPGCNSRGFLSLM